MDFVKFENKNWSYCGDKGTWVAVDTGDKVDKQIPTEVLILRYLDAGDIEAISALVKWGAEDESVSDRPCNKYDRPTTVTRKKIKNRPRLG